MVITRCAPTISVVLVTGIVAAAGRLGSSFPPLVMGARLGDYTVGLPLWQPRRCSVTWRCTPRLLDVRGVASTKVVYESSLIEWAGVS